jgi:hypothetical protein
MICLVCAQAAGAGVLEQCADVNSERQVSLCTIAIESYSINDARRSQAYDNRGIAYAREEQHERALADFNEAIRLAPDNAVARPQPQVQ